MAGYVPEGEDLAALVERLAMQVSAMYQEIENTLIEIIQRRITRGLDEVPALSEQLLIVQGLERDARRLLATIDPDLAAEVVAIAARAGTAAATARLGLSRNVPKGTDITDSAAHAIALIANDLGNAFDQMHLRILRYPRDAMGEFIRGGDVYQQTVANQLGSAMLGVASTDDVRRKTLLSFLEKGVTGFTDIANRRWRIGTYAEMAVRTATARAHLEAGVYRMAAAGISLGTVVGGNSACADCAAWFGKVLSTDGRPAGTYQVMHAYEDRLVSVRVDGTLDEARAQHWGHPNCACRFVAVLPGLRIPAMAAAFDPEAHAARERSRELERRERALKRKARIAATEEDTAKVTRLEKRIREIQAETRKHVVETGQRRRYDRSQPVFSDG